MTNPCRDSAAHTAVTITCRTTKCWLPSTDTGQHITEVVNRRTGGVHEVEVCAVTLGGSLNFAGPAPEKAIWYRKLLPHHAGSNHGTFPVAISHAAPAGADEVQTTVEFFDDTQRVGNTFVGTKERYHVDYQINLT